VEESSLLIAMQWIVGRIKIKDDLLGCLRVRFQEQLDQKRPTATSPG